MVTALNMCNQVLLYAGGSNYTTFNAQPEITKAEFAVRDAMRYVASLVEWKSTYKVASFLAASWNVDTVTIPDLYRLKHIEYDGNILTDCFTMYYDSVSYLSMVTLTAITSALVPTAGVIESNTTIRVNPYPDNDTDRAKLKFHYHRGFNDTFTAPTDDLLIPTDLEELVRAYAAYRLAMNNVHDAKLTRGLQAAMQEAQRSALQRNNNLSVRQGKYFY